VGPDLAIASVTVTGPLASGGSFSVTDVTKNQGSGPSDSSSTRFYFSLNATLDASDTPLGSRPVATLAAGAQQSGSTSMVLPSGLAGGSYYLLAVADGDGVVAETSESNNVWPAVIKVGPDLTVASLIVPRRHLGTALGIPAADHDTCPFGGERERDRPADVAGGARDQRRLAFESIGLHGPELYWTA